MVTRAEDLEGEVVEVDEEEVSDIELTEDGGAIARLTDDQELQEVGQFYDNLLISNPEMFPEHVLSALAIELLDDIKNDREARKERDKQYAEAIKRTGLGKEAPGGAQFQGASRVVHPMLTQATVDFASRAIRELMPPNGPVRVFIPGDEIDPKRLEKAQRKKNFLNWQFLHQMPEFRSELEQLLTQLPLGGSMYLRLTPDTAKRKVRPVPLFVPLDDVYIPYAASNFYTAERQTWAQKLTKYEFETRVKEEMYKNVDLIHSQMPEQSEAEKATDKIEGKTPNFYNEDGLRIVYEISRWLDVPTDQGSAPYRIELDEASRKIVSIVRNWEEGDPDLEPMQWMVEFQLIPWRGAYAVGLGQMIGSLSGAATGALRALLDSAHIQNLPTLARLKGANFTGQSTTLNATEIVEVEGGVAGDNDIRKLLMPIPYAGPSETLFKLLGFMVDAGQGFVHVAMDKMAENNTNMPVGTTLALIEEGMRVMSAIHLRLYHSMTYLIRILHRIDKMYLTEEELRNDIGEVLAKRDDFQGPLDCIPTADPEIFSDVQRIAQAQIVADRAALLPDLYNRRETEKMLLERAKIPHIDALLIPEQKPERMNQVNENVAMALGRPVAAFPDQDHLAHLQVLFDFLTSPMLGQNPVISQQFLPPALEHAKEHILYWYVTQFMQIVEEETGMEMGEIMRDRDPRSRERLDQVLAAASPDVIQVASQEFAQALPILQQAVQAVSQMAPPMSMPTDPNKMAAVQAKKEGDRLKAETEQAKIAARTQEKQAELQFEREQAFVQLSAEEQKEALITAREEARQAAEHAARLQELSVKERAEDERADKRNAVDERINTQDNVTALRIAAAEIESSENVSASTGKGINQNPSGGKKR